MKTSGLWTHCTRDINLLLVVDGFGIKYVDVKDINHLFSALQDKYDITVDWTGHKYCGLTFD